MYYDIGRTISAILGAGMNIVCGICRYAWDADGRCGCVVCLKCRRPLVLSGCTCAVFSKRALVVVK